MIGWHACMSTFVAFGDQPFATTRILDSEPDNLRTPQCC